MFCFFGIVIKKDVLFNLPCALIFLLCLTVVTSSLYYTLDVFQVSFVMLLKTNKQPPPPKLCVQWSYAVYNRIPLQSKSPVSLFMVCEVRVWTAGATRTLPRTYCSISRSVKKAGVTFSHMVHRSRRPERQSKLLTRNEKWP